MTTISFLLLSVLVAAQRAPDLEGERAAFARWLRTSPVSPYATIYHQPLEHELTLGPEGDPALRDIPSARIVLRRSRCYLRTAAGEQVLPRDRAVALGRWQVRVSGEGDRWTVTVFGPNPDIEPPGWYPAAAWIVDGVLEPPGRRESRRMLGLDGIEVEATLAGVFVGDREGRPLRLTVFRMPEPGAAESDLMIFFRDSTSGNGSYPAGRFLALQPLGAGYRADFNRARNPFCAYNGRLPCPLPWPGNAIAAAVRAGERYAAR